MTGNQHDIVTILVKYALHSSLTLGEEEALAQWRERSDEHATLPDRFRDRRWLEEQQRELHTPPTEAMWEDIRQYIDETGDPSPVLVLHTRRRIGWARLSSAVLLLAAMVLGGMQWARDRRRVATVSRMTVPFGYKALLALDDGSLIVLDTLKVGAFIVDGPVRIRKADSAHYIYTTGVLPEGVLRHRLMLAPGAGVCGIEWPDGSDVLLHGGASLDYAVDWRSSDVRLSGEAWFRVAPDAGRPATISLADGTLVRVLGTSFEMLGAADARASRVALFSGAVRVVAGADSLLLRPGSQASISSQRIATGGVNKDSVLAWARPAVDHPYFDFRDADLLTMLPQIAAWYGVQVNNPRRLVGVKITGQFSRTMSLAALFGDIQSIEERHVSMKLEGGMIMIAPLTAGD